MLSIFIIWLYIAFSSFSYGVLWLEVLFRTNYIRNKTLVPIEIILLAGIGVLSVIVSILHLFLPISVTIQSILLVGSLCILWFCKYTFVLILRTHKDAAGYTLFYWILFFIFLLLILIHAAQPIIAPDTGLYHAQTIQWFTKYKIVPGLGNLFGPLALNSHAHVLMSFFSWSFFKVKTFPQAWTSFIFLLYSSYALRAGLKSADIRPAFAIFYFGSLFWGLVFFRDWISSPTPDPIVMFFFFFLFGVLLASEKNQEADWQAALVFFILPVLISFKLSALFGGIIGIAWLIILKKNIDYHLIKLIGLQCLFVLIPFLLRNIILSGHLLYPLHSLDVFDFDWKMPRSWLTRHTDEITMFARVPTGNWPNYKNASIVVWLKIWWVNQNRPDKVFLAILGFLLPFFWGQTILNIRRKSDLNLIILWLSAFIASIVWFCTAPAIRFGYGYLVPTLLIGMVLLMRAKITTRVILSLAVCMAIYGINGIYKQINRANFSLIWPHEYPKAIIRVRQIGKLKVRVAIDDGRCWNEPIPCTYPIAHPGLEMRGKEIENGFRTSKN